MSFGHKRMWKQSMQVRVLLFASYREIVGRQVLDLDVPAGTTAGDMFGHLEVDHPDLSRLRAYTTFAVNREVVPSTAELHPNDEVALLQPVSGGRQ